jgi:hypothetical protein
MDSEVNEVSLEEALKLVKAKKTKMVWLGSEPIDYICHLLSVDRAKFRVMDPNDLIYSDKKTAESFKDSVFLCYHGNSSKYVAAYLKEKYGVESYSLKGGVTRIVGEIF